jgi:hypothetical protein|tara:strand:+ start:170 stop:490 length:321 start_codon:yes stop_codon:yes gene_type:complete
MKNRLNKITIAFLALGFLVLLFPMRTGSLKTFKMSTTLIGNVGPCFILSDPSAVSIHNAIFDAHLTKNLPHSKLYYKSQVDYGRTFILLLLTLAGSLVAFLWSRKI